MKKFIEQSQPVYDVSKYSAGIVYNCSIAYEQKGAEDTFSIGQPVYDVDGNLMGYIGIGLFEHLDYSQDFTERVPVEHWVICLPTKFCIEGKKVVTYWQKYGTKNG